MCSEIFFQGHKCIKSQLYHIMIADGDGVREPEEFIDVWTIWKEWDKKKAMIMLSLPFLHVLMGIERC